MKKVFLGIVTLILAALIGGVIFAWYQLNLDLGHRFSDDWNSYPKPEMPYQDVRFTTLDGIKIAGWYIPTSTSKALVIVVHGYNPVGGKAESLPHAKYLYENGYSSLLIDTRGVGESEGKKVTLGATEWRDLEAAYDYVKSLPENKDKKIGFLGESMGAVISIITAGQTGKGDFVIADVPFANYKRLFKYQAKKQGLDYIPGVENFARTAAFFALAMDYSKYSPDNLISKIKVPIFISWSPNDDYIGPNQGEYLFQIANEPKEEWKTDLGHDVIDNDLEGFKIHVLNFLKKNI